MQPLTPEQELSANHRRALIPTWLWRFRKLCDISFVYSQKRSEGKSSCSKCLYSNMAADIDRLVSFEEAHYDQYDYYNLEEYPCHAGGKGRSKKEIGLNTNRHCPAGHERKIAGKLQNSEIKRRRTKSSSSWGTWIEVSMIRCVLMHTCWETCPGKSSTLFVHQLPFYVTTRDQIFITCTNIGISCFAYLYFIANIPHALFFCASQNQAAHTGDGWVKPDRGPNVCSAFFPDPLNVDLIQLEGARMRVLLLSRDTLVSAAAVLTWIACVCVLGVGCHVLKVNWL